MKQEFAAFIDDLRSTHGGNLVSVILYGSAAAPDAITQPADHTLLIALKKIGPADLRNAHACIREWARLGNPVPVYFTVSELQTASDVFPIEFQEMSQARQVLYGADVLSGISINDKFLRLQTEYELRSKLIQLRRQYIPASTSVDGLMGLMANSLATFTALFRAVLILRGLTPPIQKREVIALTADQLKIDGSVFEKILNIRENNFAARLSDVEANALFGTYMEQIEKVIEAVDVSAREANLELI